jgi:hypothetical protein
VLANGVYNFNRIEVISALRSGQAMTLDPTCGDMIPTMTFAPDQMDDFDRWSRQQARKRRNLD